MANEVRPSMIYTNQVFDDRNAGEKPTGFEMLMFKELYILPEKEFRAAYDNVEIVRREKDGNADNLAVRLSGYVDEEGDHTAFVRRCFNYLPIQKKAVISFSFLVNDFLADKKSFLNTNVCKGHHVWRLDNDSYVEFITVRGRDVYWLGKEVVKEDIDINTWYRADLAFDVETGQATLYFDGTATKVTLPEGIVNVSEVRFDMPAAEDSSWLIDELRVYEADDLVPDEEINAEWKRYTDSVFYFGDEFEPSGLTNYDYLAFRLVYDKVFAVIHSNKLYANNRVIKLPAPIYKEKDRVMVPACAVAEVLGAKAMWDADSGKLSVSYAGREMVVASDQYILADGTACMAVDALLGFMGKTYSEKHHILWFGEPMVCEQEVPKGLFTRGLRTVEERIYHNITTRLLFERPSAMELDRAIRKYSPENKHPRLMIDDFEQIRSGIKRDPQLKKAAEDIIAEAKKCVDAPTLKHELGDGKRAAYAGAFWGYFWPLCFAYRFSEEENVEKYKDSIWRQIEAIYNFPDFNIHRHFLCMGQCCHGLYLVYDWLYDVWTPKQRAMIEEVCRRNIFEPIKLFLHSALECYAGQVNSGVGNQGIINNGGVAALALALYDSDPDYYGPIIRGALRGAEAGFLDFFPDGEWNEGISYWRYTMQFMPYVIKSIQTACGTDFGITQVPGVLKTGYFPLRLRGATNGFAFGDGQAESGNVGAMMFLAEQTGDKALARYRKSNMDFGSIPDVFSWVYDTGEDDTGLLSLPLDTYMKSNSTVIMKTGWDQKDTAVAFHGGANNDPHGHVDSGSFQFDMSGVRFAVDLPRELYNLTGLGHYDAGRVREFYPDGPVYTGGHYYRSKGEGHNCIVANRQEINRKLPSDPGSYDMRPAGRSEFISTEFGKDDSFALLDMTDLNDVFESATRQVKLDKVNNVIEIQDDIKAVKETDFLWSMHTYAIIELSEDRKSAILTQDGVSIKASILSAGDEVFEVLPAAFLEDYGTSVKPDFETPNTVYTKEDVYYLTHGKECDVSRDARKLAIRTVTDHVQLTVAFHP